MRPLRGQRMRGELLEIQSGVNTSVDFELAAEIVDGRYCGTESGDLFCFFEGRVICVDEEVAD